MTRLIDTIELPQDLRQLPITELQQAAEELRDELIDDVALSGGHLASSLGAAELTVALHSVFHTPHDKLVWDVGHQAYIHKMITGRRDMMHSIRKKDGLSGFPRPDESPYDAFIAGHAGTSISAAVGIALSLKRTGSENYAIAVIGDGSMTNGMAFEALNHAGGLELSNLIVVLNDNEMSISPNVGALKWFFSRTLTSPIPSRARNWLKRLYKQGIIPKPLFALLDRSEAALQGFISGPARLFEAFRFRYVGPIDAHNMEDLVRALENAKSQHAPVLVHACSKKGKGYRPAEQDPVSWHGVTPFSRNHDSSRIEATPRSSKSPPTYTEVFGKTVAELAELDSRVVAITAAMGKNTGLSLLESKYPERVYDVGICEEHAVTMAAGLASGGVKPICAIYSTFLQRAFDQIMHDVCLQNLPVLFAIDRAGAVGADGHTHQGLFDLAFLRALPDIVLMSPKDENELRHMIWTGLKLSGPAAIRYPRGSGCGKTLDPELTQLPIGKGEIVRRGKDILFICYGPIIKEALLAAEMLQDSHQASSTVINARFAKPLDRELIIREIAQHQLICTVEDHAIACGFGSAVLELAQDVGINSANPIKRFGVGDSFVPHASQKEQYRLCGYDARTMYEHLSRLLPRKKIA